MNLRTQLTIAFLFLTLVPTAVVSVTALLQVNELNEIWESAGFEEQFDLSINVARRSLERMQYDLEHAAGPLVQRWRDEVPDFEIDDSERLYVTRFLEDVGFDFVLIYARSDTAYVLTSGIYPARLESYQDVLQIEISEHDPSEGPLRSSVGAFAHVEDITGGYRVVVGYLLAENFFTNLGEVMLGGGMLSAIEDYRQDRQTFTVVLILSMLSVIAILAILGGWLLSQRLAGPVTELSEQLESMVPGPALLRVSEPEHASREVRALTSAFNALTERLRTTQRDLMRTERVAGSALVARHVAHEIKNHLSTLGLATYRIERRFHTLPEDEQAVSREALTAMRKEFEVLEDMAETFSELGRMSEPLLREQLQLNNLIQSVRALHAEGPVKFETRLAEDLPAVVGDERSLRRLLANLVKNATEAQKEGGLVTASTRLENGFVILEVADQGPGIADNVLERVFEPGYTTKKGGSGVGLFLVRTIVERHRGRIEIDSEIGSGTVVRVALPAYRQDRSAA